MSRVLSDMLAGVLADPLAPARRSAAPVAYVGCDLPPDLALATERTFSHLPWRAGRATPWADRWLERSFPGWARSMLEDWAAGEYDFFDAVVFSRGDDATQRLYYYVCELQRRGRLGGPRPLVLDVACIPRPSSVQHCRRALARLLGELDMTPGELRRGVEAANLRRRWYQDLLRARRLPGRLLENLARALLFQDLYGKLPEPAADAAPARLPLLLAGSAPPDDRFHRAAEAAGWNVCAEVHARSLARYGPPLEDCADDALGALALRLNGDAYLSRSFVDRAALLEREVLQSGARAVVLWLTDEDESLAWDVVRQRALLERLGLPSLVLTRRRWDGGDGAVDELSRFLEENRP